VRRPVRRPAQRAVQPKSRGIRIYDGGGAPVN
jgi:hypothetical protein